jgi:hypothetical protein
MQFKCAIACTGEIFWKAEGKRYWDIGHFEIIGKQVIGKKVIL